MFLFAGWTAAGSHTLNVLLAALLLAAPLATAHAQGGINYTGTGGRHTIQGRIFSPSGRQADALNMKVKLENPSTGTLTVFTDVNGSFSFKNLTGGSYTVVVEAGDDYELASETVYIDDMSSRNTGVGVAVSRAPRVFTVQIHLRAKPRSSPEVRPGLINAALAAVPEPARDLYQKALESARAGNSKEAIERLKGAIALYPDFALAFNELGVQYLKLRRTDEAIEAFRSALKLTPDAFLPQLNYGIAFYQKKEFATAETELRQAIRKNGASPSAHLYLGMTLIPLRRYDDAEQELQQAISLGGKEMSLAHYYLGGIYWGRREYKRAADELETYLKLAPKAPDAERVRATIKELRSK